MNTFLHTLGSVAAVVGAVSAWAFVLIYRRRNWRQWAEGKHLMVFTSGLAVIMTYVSIRAVTQSGANYSTGDELWRLGIYGFVASMLGWRALLVWQAR